MKVRPAEASEESVPLMDIVLQHNIIQRLLTTKNAFR